MGIHVLEGMCDGDSPGAIMYDSVSGWAFGPIFEGPTAASDVSEFLDWLAREPYLLLASEIRLTSQDVSVSDARDARTWPRSGLTKLVNYWIKEVKNG